MSFAIDMDKFIARAKGNEDIVVRKIITDLATKIIYRTPVGDPSFWINTTPLPGYAGGSARINWQYGFNSAPEGEIEGQDKIGSKAVEAIIKGVSTQPTAGNHWIVNNLPYIGALEDGTVSPRQAPDGMVKISIAEFDQLVDVAADAAL